MATETILNNPIILVIVPIIVIAIIAYRIYSKRGGYKFKDFRPKEFRKTIKDELKQKMNMLGIQVKGGKLYVGIHVVARLDKYFIGKSKTSTFEYDPKTGTMRTFDVKDDKTTEFVFLRVKSTSIILRIFGLGKKYFILSPKSVIRDKYSRSFFLPATTDFTRYADVWMNMDKGIDYVSDISMKRTNEYLQTLLESLPERYAHFEFEQVKKERTGKVYMNLEKSKWDDRKVAGDSVVTE